jgi:sporulation protein YtfJ
VIIPVSKVGFGFAAGGSEFKVPLQIKGSESETTTTNGDKMPFGGGSGGGVSITPVAFIIVSGKEIKLLNLESSTHLYDRIIDLVENVANKKRKTQTPSDGDPPQMYC